MLKTAYGSVFVNAQTNVFTSEKSVEYVQNFRAGVRKISNFGCIRPFVFSRTYMNAQQALRRIKYYFVCMKISRPVEAGCLGSRRILTYFHRYRRARERISWHNVCSPKARSAAFTLVTNLS